MADVFVRDEIKRHGIDQTDKHDYVAAAQSSQDKRRPGCVDNLRVAGYERHDGFCPGNIADYFRVEVVLPKQSKILRSEQHHVARRQAAEANANLVLGVRRAAQAKHDEQNIMAHP